MPLFLPGPGPWPNPSEIYLDAAVTTLDLTAADGLATFAGNTASLSFTLTAASGLSTFGGGTASLTEVVTASTGVATFGGGTASIAEVVTAASGLATFGGGDASLTAEAFTVTIVAAGRTYLVTRAGLPATSGYRVARTSQITGELSPAVSAGADLTASNGLATFTGSATTLTVALTASSGLATAGGGTADLAVTATASNGLATFGGGTASITEVLTAASGLATFGGGDATYSTPVIGIPNVVGRGLATGLIRAPGRPVPLSVLVRQSTVVGALTPTPSVDLTASSGLATFGGQDASVSVTTTGQIPGAVVAGGSPNIFRSLRRAQANWIPPRLPTRAFAAYTAPPEVFPATFGGGTASVSFTGVLNLTASNGVATFNGGTANLTEVLTAASGLVTFGGGTATAQSFTGLFATNGLATFGGGTASFRAIYAVSGGVATFNGGTVHRFDVATGGVASFLGGTVTFRPTYATAGGLSTFGGGVAIASTPTLGLIDGSTDSSGGDGSTVLSGVDGSTGSFGVDGTTDLGAIIDGNTTLVGVG